MPLGIFEQKPGEFAPLLARLKKLKTTISVGVRAGYLLIGIGESADSLAKFGGDGPKLSSLPEFKPLAKFANRPIISIGYTSAAIQPMLVASKEDLANFAILLKSGLEESGLNREQRAALEKDLDALAKYLTKSIQKPAAEVNFSFRTPTGWESYAYDYSPQPSGESRPLTLLNHLGGDPLMAWVGRSGTTVEGYERWSSGSRYLPATARKWCWQKCPKRKSISRPFIGNLLPCSRS